MIEIKEKRKNDNDLAVAKSIIANCRKAHDITQTMIAKESGESLSTIQKIASQSHPITAEQLQNIKDAANRLTSGQSRIKVEEERQLSEAYFKVLVTNFKSLTIEQKKVLSAFSTFVKSIVD